jgi:excisionase family DNA binding protein
LSTLENEGKEVIILPDKLFFKVGELAAILQIEKKTLYSWIDTGRLDAVKIGGWAVRITRQAALKIIEEVNA